MQKKNKESLTKMVNLRDIAGNAEKEEEKSRPIW